MKNLLSLTAFVIVCQITTQAQEEKKDEAKAPKTIYHLDRQNPLFILDGNELSDSTSLASFNLNDIQSMEILNEEQAVKAFGNKGIKGVIIITSKSRSGGSIRFINSDHATNPSPLFILDGIELKEKSFASINPDYIEQVTVLKDKGAEPYGDKGKNGVVLITTKKYQQSKSTLNR